MQAGDALPAEGQRRTSFNRLSFRSCHTLTVEESTAALTGVLTCVPERAEQVLQEDVMETAVDRLFARWEAGGISMVLLALEDGTVLPPTIQCLLG